MNTHRSRAIAAVALALLLPGVGFWLGEAGGPPWAPVPIAIGVIGCLAVALSIPGNSILKSVAGVFALLGYAVTFVAGLWSFSHASVSYTHLTLPTSDLV